MSFPREEIESTTWRLLKQAYLEVVCFHTGRNWRALSEEERADVLSKWHPSMERDVGALAAVAMHAYEAGVGTVHARMAEVDADPLLLDEAVQRAAEEAQTRKDDGDAA